jgi:peptidoglycan/xylan/chitin deacetylase (PgdA/CDA1 family)
VIYRFPKTEPLAALTIDDSPFARSTPAILDVLERVGAKATFFVIGSYVQGNEGLLERIVQMGHEIGNHMLRDSQPPTFTWLLPGRVSANRCDSA